MTLTDPIVSTTTTLKKKHWTRFRELSTRPLPQRWPEPTPEEAFRMGLKMGYGEGLVEGVGLGVELMMGAASQATASMPFDVS